MTTGIVVQAILFDMDGVLISSTGADERCWMRWARLHGMENSFSIRDTHGRRSVDTIRALRPDLDPEVELHRLEDFDAADSEGLIVLPGVLKLLASLPEDRWAIVTSASERLLRQRLGVVGVPVPKIIVTADRVQNGKPHPEPYSTGARLLGFAPADCLVIEDSPAGIGSATAAGCPVLGVLTSHTAPELTGANWLVPTLDAVTAKSASPVGLAIEWDNQVKS